MESASRVLESFVDALDLRDISLVVHDLGGPVALGVAAGRPDRFGALVVTEPFAWPLSQANPAIARVLRVVGSRAVDHLNRATDLIARDRRMRRFATAMLHDAVAGEAYLRAVDTALRTVLRPLPVLLVFGSRSPAIKAGFPAGWKSRHPEAQLFLLDGAHHFPMMDDPDAVAHVIASWWEAAAPVPVTTGRV
jgi:pimeloyl-ACP methyl ester carboxylesterase